MMVQINASKVPYLFNIVCTQTNYVADNSTKRCQTTCTTGYAYWDIKMCVAICPATPALFSYNLTDGTGRICDPSCNSSLTGTFGDAQANRTCKAVCTSTPVSTWGDITTNKCEQLCTSGTFGDPLDGRKCKSTCTSPNFAESVSRLCVGTCPEGYYGDPYSMPG